MTSIAFMTLLTPWVVVVLAPALWLAQRTVRIQGSFWRLLGASVLFYFVGFGILAAAQTAELVHVGGVYFALGVASQLGAIFLAFIVVTRASAMRSLVATLISAAVSSALLAVAVALVWRLP